MGPKRRRHEKQREEGRRKREVGNGRREKRGARAGSEEGEVESKGGRRAVKKQEGKG